MDQEALNSMCNPYIKFSYNCRACYKFYMQNASMEYPVCINVFIIVSYEYNLQKYNKIINNLT